MSEPTTEAALTDVEIAADLGRQLADSRVIKCEIPDLIARVVSEDERIETVDLEYLADEPRRARGRVTLDHPHDFARYVAERADESTVLFANQSDALITAVFNDHIPGRPGFRDNRVVLDLQPDPDWLDWIRGHGQLASQAEFAAFIDEHAQEVTNPDPATMREVSLAFRARRTASFDSRVDVGSADVSFKWSEETTASAGRKTGQPVEVPREFTVELTPLVGADPVTITARLVWDVDRDGKLTIGYRLRRPHDAVRISFEGVCAKVAATLPESVPLHRGRAPQGLFDSPFGLGHR